MKRLILGSQSPRRKEILSYFDLPFDQISPNVDEDKILFKGDPGEYVNTLSKMKAEVLQLQYPDAIILTADTVVYRNGKIYNKPKDEQEAFQALSELVGQWHSVFTGVTVSTQDNQYHQWEEARVLFNPLTPEEIRHYHKRIHWADKAGGYAIQMGGGLIVRRIEGCYYNVMGLPINTVRTLLQKVGIELWDYVK
jgi:septum formation protein